MKRIGVAAKLRQVIRESDQKQWTSDALQEAVGGELTPVQVRSAIQVLVESRDLKYSGERLGRCYIYDVVPLSVHAKKLFWRKEHQLPFSPPKQAEAPAGEVEMYGNLPAEYVRSCPPLDVITSQGTAADVLRWTLRQDLNKAEANLRELEDKHRRLEKELRETLGATQRKVKELEEENRRLRATVRSAEKRGLVGITYNNRPLGMEKSG